jgi:hypothetical protein
VRRAPTPVLIRSYSDKLYGSVFVGIGDWAYEEDIFYGSKAMHFRDDGTKLAFAVVYDVNVRTAAITKYGDKNAYFQASQI